MKKRTRTIKSHPNEKASTLKKVERAIKKTDEDKAVALIESITSICDELGKYMNKHTPAIVKARKKLHHKLEELELKSLFIIPNKEEVKNRKLISKVASTIKKNQIKIKL